MGLMYVFPVSTEEEDFVETKEGLTLKTYGLPYIFWLYALGAILVILFMFLAIKDPVLKLIKLGDDTDSLLGWSLLGFLAFLPVGILSFFFYEKRIHKNKTQIKLIHKIFGLTFFSETFELSSNDPFSIEAFLSSPNIARIKGTEESRGFQNKGYFILWLKLPSGKRIQIDRHSRKGDLEKIKNLLQAHY